MDFFGLGIDRHGIVFDDRDAVVTAQAAIGGGDVAELLATGQHEVGNGARNEGVLRLDQHDVDFVPRQKTHVTRSGGAAIAAANHHHLGFGRHAGARGAAGEAKHAEGGSRLQNGTALRPTSHGGGR